MILFETVAGMLPGSSAGTFRCAVITASTPAAIALAEGRQLHGFNSIVIGIQARQRQMAVFGGVTMAGEMLGGDQHGILAVRMRAVDVGFHEARHLLRVFAEGADVDDGIIGVIVNVGHRREQPVDAHGARIASGVRPLLG